MLPVLAKGEGWGWRPHQRPWLGVLVEYYELKTISLIKVPINININIGPHSIPIPIKYYTIKVYNDKF
jgi:hypothetical protein